MKESSFANPFSQKAPPGKASSPEREAWTAERDKVWEQGKTGELRTEWEEVMNTLTAQYQSLHPAQPKDSVPELPGSQASVVFASQVPEIAAKTAPALPTVDEQPSIQELSQLSQQHDEHHPYPSTTHEPLAMGVTPPPDRERELSSDGLLDPGLMDPAHMGSFAQAPFLPLNGARNSCSPPPPLLPPASDVNMDPGIVIDMPYLIDQRNKAREAEEGMERPSTLSPARAPASRASASAASSAGPTPSPFSDFANMSGGDFGSPDRKHQNLVPTNNLASLSRAISYAQPERGSGAATNPPSSHWSDILTPPPPSSPAKRQDVERAFRQQVADDDVQTTTAAAPPPTDHVPYSLDALGGEEEEEEPPPAPRRPSPSKPRATLYNDLDDADDEGTPAAGSPAAPPTRKKNVARKSTGRHAPSDTRARTTLSAQAAGGSRASSASASAASSHAGSTGAGPSGASMMAPLSGKPVKKRAAVRQYGRTGPTGAAGEKRRKSNEEDGDAVGTSFATAIDIQTSSDEEH